MNFTDFLIALRTSLLFGQRLMRPSLSMTNTSRQRVVTRLARPKEKRARRLKRRLNCCIFSLFTHTPSYPLMTSSPYTLSRILNLLRQRVWKSFALSLITGGGTNFDFLPLLEHQFSDNFYDAAAACSLQIFIFLDPDGLLDHVLIDYLVYFA